MDRRISSRFLADCPERDRPDQRHCLDFYERAPELLSREDNRDEDKISMDCVPDDAGDCNASLERYASSP